MALRRSRSPLHRSNWPPTPHCAKVIASRPCPALRLRAALMDRSRTPASGTARPTRRHLPAHSAMASASGCEAVSRHAARAGEAPSKAAMQCCRARELSEQALMACVRHCRRRANSSAMRARSTVACMPRRVATTGHLNAGAVALDGGASPIALLVEEVRVWERADMCAPYTLNSVTTLSASSAPPTVLSVALREEERPDPDPSSPPLPPGLWPKWGRTDGHPRRRAASACAMMSRAPRMAPVTPAWGATLDSCRPSSSSSLGPGEMVGSCSGAGSSAPGPSSPPSSGGEPMGLNVGRFTCPVPVDGGC